MVNQLNPEASDYIVLKPKPSAFYATPPETLFSYLKVKTAILAGLITNACILSTAMNCKFVNCTFVTWPSMFRPIAWLRP
jgi:nicotinamidase-related amidase